MRILVKTAANSGSDTL